MQLIDSHAHLDFGQFDGDREAVIARARRAGLVAIVNVGADLASSRAAVALAEGYDFIYATVGVHPHDARTVTPDVLENLRALARHPTVVAVGEIGLDYYRDLSPRPVQRRAFREQLGLASELGLPVVIHSRDAHDDVLAILEAWEGNGVLHSYSAGLDLLDRVMRFGFYVGLSGPVTFPKADGLRAVAGAVPLDRLLVETDCPYLTPTPHRGERNEPAYVRYVVETVARSRWMEAEQVASATSDNARRLFGI
ncbi:MAG TPA: TatD family deoxyribonuclease [Chloroflexi bacterium]|nr:TatD family deoxyribonuclease [Chloroflexota bacterium]